MGCLSGGDPVIQLRSSVLHVAIACHGARIARLAAPDRDGTMAEVVLGLDEDAYPADQDYLGATVGRYANRIADGRFVLDGTEHRVPCNEGTVALHGGAGGLDHATFKPGPVVPTDDGASLALRHVSPAGHNGFPGTLDVTVTYTVSGGELRIGFVATTDAPTVVNLTNHAYFTLGGTPEDVGELEVAIFADRYLPIDTRLLPTGDLAPVAGTVFDLREMTPLRERLDADDPQAGIVGGFDHTWVLDGSGPAGADPVPTADHAPTADGRPLATAARVRHPRSGRIMRVFTDQPGVQFYTGNLLDGTLALHTGGTAHRGEAFCLEPQHFPDSPNRPHFPSTVLRPGETYHAHSVYRFEVSAAE